MRSQGLADHASQDQRESWPASPGEGLGGLGPVSPAVAGLAWSEHSALRWTEPSAPFFWVLVWLQELSPGTPLSPVPGMGQGWERS